MTEINYGNHGRNVQEIQSLFQDLQDDLLYNLMSANKELFHSNLHAWLFRRCPELKKFFFNQFSHPADLKLSAVNREEKNIDLILREPGYANIVIENKIYADLHFGQLDKYTDVMNDIGQPWTGYVLSLVPPEFNRYKNTTRKKWKWLSYDDFIHFIELNKSQQTLTKFELHYLDGYIEMIKKLSAAINALLPGSNEAIDYLPLNFDKTFLANINRMRSRIICSYLSNEVAQKSSESTVFEKMYFGSGITRNKIFLECEIPLKDGNFLGWQLQESQFRLYARVVNLSGIGKHEDRVAYAFKKYRFWFNFDEMYYEEFLPLVLMPKNKDTMGKFDPDFVYRYSKITGIKLATLLRVTLALGRREFL